MEYWYFSAHYDFFVIKKDIEKFSLLPFPNHSVNMHEALVMCWGFSIKTKTFFIYELRFRSSREKQCLLFSYLKGSQSISSSQGFPIITYSLHCIATQAENFIFINLF